MILLQAIASLALRFGLAVPFWRSGLVRWEAPFELSGATKYLYANDYKLNFLVQIGLVDEAPSVPFADMAAWLGSAMEIVLPAALVIGFATRLSALGLLGMTAVIFLVNPASWSNETLPWAAMAIALIAYGPGVISVDHFIRRDWGKR